MPFSSIKLKKQISESLGLSNLSAAQQDKIISKLMDNISARISIAVLDGLDKKERKELEKASKSKEKDAVLGYLNSKINNLSLLIADTVAETIGDFKRLRGSLD